MIGGVLAGALALSVAAAQGSEGDPLVTLGYLTDRFLPRVLEEVEVQMAERDKDLESKIQAMVDTYSEDMEKTFRKLATGSDSVSVPRELASDYLSAFALSASLPDIGAGQSGNMYEFEYTKPSDAQTKVTDFLSNTDGTYTAYVDYVNAGVIEKRYIITLVGNAHTMAAAKYVFSYTVTAAVEFE